MSDGGEALLGDGKDIFDMKGFEEERKRASEREGNRREIREVLSVAIESLNDSEKVCIEKSGKPSYSRRILEAKVAIYQVLESLDAESNAPDEQALLIEF